MNKDIENTIANKIVAMIKKEKNIGMEDKNIQICPLTTCISIRFFKTPTIKIVCGKNKKYISINPNLKKLLDNYTFIKTETIKSDPWTRLLFNNQNDLEKMNPLFLRIYDEVYLMSSTDRFGCCSRYLECSDAKKCVNSNQILARGCVYRLNLIDGKIFYGENRNI